VASVTEVERRSLEGERLVRLLGGGAPWKSCKPHHQGAAVAAVAASVSSQHSVGRRSASNPYIQPRKLGSSSTTCLHAQAVVFMQQLGRRAGSVSRRLRARSDEAIRDFLTLGATRKAREFDSRVSLRSGVLEKKQRKKM